MAKRSRTGIRARVRRFGRRRWAALGALAAVLAGAGVWFGMAAGDDDGSDTQRITSTVARGTYKTTVSATGTITPKRDADVAFASSGTVTSVQVSEGDPVAKGDVLATIDDTALVAQREAASSALTAARTQLSEDSGSSSTQVAADEASVAAAESQLAQAEEAVDNATLRAPFAGTVSVVGYEVGDSVGSGSANPGGSDSGTAAITVISPARLLVEANVSAADVTQLKKGLQAEITPTGGADVAYGTVTKVAAIATASDSGAAQFPVTIEVTGKPTGLYPGSSATVAITVKQATDIIAVPTAAVRTDDDGTSYVNVVKDGKNVKTPVELGTVYGAQTEVTSGVEVGDVVEVISITGRRGTGTNRGGGAGGGDFSFPAGEIPGGGSFPGGFAPGGGPGLVVNGG